MKPAFNRRDRESGHRPPRIGIYAGRGTSHSWLWFVDLCDGAGLHHVRFLDEASVASGDLGTVDLFVLSGGDTFAVAEALGTAGAAAVESFVRRGGVYVGSCAGAYLPLRSSKPHLNRFNFVNVRIANLAKTLPAPERMPHKFCTAYGCRYVFHPVREQVVVRTHPVAPWNRSVSFEAPLYGGPVLIPYDDAEVLAWYTGFTAKTLFLVEKELAGQTLLGRAAAVRSRLGKGCFCLFGPHVEHPRFPEANRLLLDLIQWELRPFPSSGNGNEHPTVLLTGRERSRFLREMRREISNSRIVAAGMETAPLLWLIGAKVYEPEKIRVFLEAMWKRIRILERREHLKIRAGGEEALVRTARETTALLRNIKAQTDEGADTTAAAERLFGLLHQWCTEFLDCYFRTVSRHGSARTPAPVPRRPQATAPSPSSGEGFPFGVPEPFSRPPAGENIEHQIEVDP